MGLINTQRLGRFLDKVKVLIDAKADANHTHSYLPLTGGSLSGDLNVQGIVRVKGNQAVYDNGTVIMFGSANRNTTVGCADNGDVNIHGGRIYAPSVVPRTNNAYQIGNTSYRYKGIYLTSQPNVSSDRRKKRDIHSLDSNRLANFVEKLMVVGYNYNSDPAESKERIGVIAQDVLRADPEIAEYFVDQDENGYYSLRPGDLVFPLISAVQMLTKRVQDLENKQS